MSERLPSASRTDFLFYREPETLEFEAEILEERPAGDRFGLVLSRSAFFPGGGGQPEDGGTLDGVPVVGFSVDGEDVVHLVEAERWKARPAGAGKSVSGRVDGRRRAHYREQHTGQHLVSACLKNVLDLDTVSVHFGEDSTTIEISSPSVPEGGLARVEAEANRLIAGNPRVETFWIDEAELPKYELRRTPSVSGRLRIVRVEGIDTSACCGVHLSSLGTLGFVKMLGEERIRGRVRIRLTTGSALLEDYGRKAAVIERLKVLFTCGEREMTDAASRLLEDSRELRRKISEQRKELYGFRVRELALSAPRLPLSSGGSATFLAETIPSVLQDALSDFVSRALDLPDTFVAVASEDPAGTKVSWIVAHNLDVKAVPETDLGKLLRPLVNASGGRGGGTAARWQGGFPSARDWEAFLADLRTAAGISG